MKNNNNTNNKKSLFKNYNYRKIQDIFFQKKQKFMTKLINVEFFFFFPEYIHEQ